MSLYSEQDPQILGKAHHLFHFYVIQQLTSIFLTAWANDYITWELEVKEEPSLLSGMSFIFPSVYDSIRASSREAP